MTSRLYLLYGWCDASVTSQRTRSSHTWPDWTSMAESKSTEWTIPRLMHLVWHGSPSDLWSSLASNFVGYFAKLILLWSIYKLLLKWTSTWNFHKSSRPHTGTPHVLNLEKNIYSQKQAGCVWNSFLMNKLMSIRFTPSLIDDCTFFCNDIIFMVYVDDGVFLGNNDSKLQDAIKDIKDLGLNIEDQGHPAGYLGVNIKKLWDGSYEFT